MSAKMRRALALVGVTSLAVVGISLFHIESRAAAVSDPFQGIAVAEAAASGSADAQVISELQAAQGYAPGDLASQVPTGARAIAPTVDGNRAYVVPAKTGDFCLFVETLGEDCITPLTSTMPLLFIVSDPDAVGSGAGPLAYGLALDGVTSVSFKESGVTYTVPVRDNVFALRGPSSADALDVTDVKANFADGHSVAMP